MLGTAAATAFLAGVVAADLHLLIPCALVLVCCVMLLHRRWPIQPVLSVLLLLGAFGSGVLCALHGRPWLPHDAILQQSRFFEGIVVSVPRTYPTMTQAELHLTKPVTTTVTALFDPTFEIEEGMQLSMQGNVRRAMRPIATGRQTVFVLDVQSARVTGSMASTPQRWRAMVQRTLRDRVFSAVPEPAGSLTLGVLTGDDALMPPQTRATFRRAGLSHITAVSGWNLSVLAGVLEAGAGRWLGRRSLGALTLGVVWMYAYLVGMEPSVLRAAMLTTLSMVGLLLGRPRAPLLLVLWATAVLLLWDPLLRFQPGFQLSVIATIALISIQGRVKQYPRWLQVFLVACGVQAAVIPATLYWFGELSLIGPLANALVEPIVPVVMAGGVLTVLAASVHGALGQFVGVLPWLAGSLVTAVADGCTRLPGANMLMPAPSAVPVVLFYGVGLAILVWDQFFRIRATPCPS